MFNRLADACMGAARDPIFSKLMTIPAGFDETRAVTAAADALLEAGGLASWQTNRVQARGDLLMVAGSCRRHIGAAQSDALFRQYGWSDDVRERDYYTRSFQAGLDDDELDLDAAQCAKALKSFKSKAGAP